VKRAQLTAVASTSVESLRQCQAVLLPALFGATLEQTAAVLGVGRATVARLQGAFRQQRSALPAFARNWGGRRQSLLTQEEEDDFLKPCWPAPPPQPGGGFPDSSGLGATAWPAGQAVGGVSAAGAPWLAQGGSDTRHPKSKPEVQEAWKKDSPKCWKPC